MPSDLPRFTIRTEQSNIDKIAYIASYESRTTTKQIEHLIKQCISEFEATNGELIVKEDGSVILAKPKAVEGKSSTSKIG